MNSNDILTNECKKVVGNMIKKYPFVIQTKSFSDELDRRDFFAKLHSLLPKHTVYTEDCMAKEVTKETVMFSSVSVNNSTKSGFFIGLLNQEEYQKVMDELKENIEDVQPFKHGLNFSNTNSKNDKNKF